MPLQLLLICIVQLGDKLGAISFMSGFNRKPSLGPSVEGTGTVGHHRLNFWTWTVGLIIGFILLIVWITGDFGTALVFAAIIALFTGLYTLIIGRRSWMRLRGRKAGAIVVAASLVAFMVGGAIAPAPEEPDVTASSSEQDQAADDEPTAEPEPTRSEKPTKTAAPSPEPKNAKTPEPKPKPEPKKQVKDKAGTRALALLETIPIKGRAPKTGYDRDQFGNDWEDIDGNGCDTRNDILAEQMRAIVYEAGDNCTVEAGTLTDRYTNTVIDFVQGFATSNDVHVDHVIALSDAWQKGAQQLSYAERVAFANDPLNLEAVDGPTNSSKGDSDAATWLPPNRGYWCTYVAQQISVKAAYNLWVTAAEHDAMARVLSDCKNTMAPGTNAKRAEPKPKPAPAVQPPAPAPAPKPAPAPAPEPAPVPAPVPEPPAPAPAPAPADVYYENCDAVVAAGAAPIRVGDPGYSLDLDGDGDGQACGAD